MHDPAGEVQELACLQDMGMTVGSDINGALDALNRDFSGDFVQWQ